MENDAIRTLIRQKLWDGSLPLKGIPRFWVGPSDGEGCSACDRLIVGPFVVEGIAATDGHRMPIQMHVECFAVWDEERREPREHDPRERIEAAIARRKDAFALSYMAWTASGYTVKFRLGVVDVVRTAVGVGVFQDPLHMDTMLKGFVVPSRALRRPRGKRAVPPESIAGPLERNPYWLAALSRRLALVDLMLIAGPHLAGIRPR